MVVSLALIKYRLYERMYLKLQKSKPVKEHYENEKHERIRELLIKMEKADRAYYLPLLNVVRAYTGVAFKEIRRSYAKPPSFTMRNFDGVHVINVRGNEYAGQLRYYLSKDPRASSEPSEYKDIDAFISYMKTFETSRGNLEAHKDIKEACFVAWDPLTEEPDVWSEIKKFFTPYEIERVEEFRESLDLGLT